MKSFSNIELDAYIEFDAFFGKNLSVYQPMTTPDSPDFRTELARLVDLYYALGGNWSPHGYADTWNDALASARTALATPPPEPLRPIPVSERLQQMEDLAADALAGLRYIEQSHGRLYGVGWDRVYEKADRLKPAIATELEAQSQ